MVMVKVRLRARARVTVFSLALKKVTIYHVIKTNEWQCVLQIRPALQFFTCDS